MWKTNGVCEREGNLRCVRRLSTSEEVGGGVQTRAGRPPWRAPSSPSRPPDAEASKAGGRHVLDAPFSKRKRNESERCDEGRMSATAWEKLR